MDAGHLSLRPTDFAVAPVLDGIQEMFRPQAEARGITLVVVIGPDVPERIRADCGRLRQVLMNLVSNATKFSNPGVVTIRAETIASDRGPALLFGVRDKGPRIPEQDVALLFQPFSRLDNARSRGVPGTGLGLAICERLTRLMDGRLGVGPAPSDGNDFWITLPRAAILAPSSTAGDAGLIRYRRRAAVLLVEDVPANQFVTATILRRLGHRVDVAGSGAAAIRLIQEHPYDLVFMDLSMPAMTGDDVARHVRALPGVAGQVPIVALTATTAPEDRTRCIAAGMSDMLGKPVRADELTAVINRVISPTIATARLAAPPNVPPVPPSVDLDRLADLRRGLAPATLAALVTQCLSDMRERLALLRQALVAGQATTIEESAHALAGMAATYGLAVLERRMRRVMSEARRGNLSDAAAGADEIEAELDHAGGVMRDLLRDRAA